MAPEGRTVYMRQNEEGMGDHKSDLRETREQILSLAIKGQRRGEEKKKERFVTRKKGVIFLSRAKAIPVGIVAP